MYQRERDVCTREKEVCTREREKYVLEREKYVLEREKYVLEREKYVLEREKYVLEREKYATLFSSNFKGVVQSIRNLELQFLYRSKKRSFVLEKSQSLSAFKISFYCYSDKS